MLDYTREAGEYDQTRGGEPRAHAAAAAIEELLPPGARVVADVGCGTGIVTSRLPAPGRLVVGLDRAAGMLELAAHRLPGRVARADATRLPLRDGSCDAVVTIWILHLVGHDAAAAVIAEAARVLRPGGVLITTVDKNTAGFDGSDIARVLAPLRARHYPPQSDALDRVLALGAGHGLSLAGRTRFTGHGQGRSPRTWQDNLLHHPWIAPIAPAELAPIRHGLAALPDQDTPRAEPVYTLIALQKRR
ncbi:class I SAM-dependent methyltransferase [Catellatospora sp. NPDC049609]|uniref:class I SAM-dependent methyltransferase n=1 Tax=Catellatospora sp. NPDC049609 TaxID=3155505 RepID=UPI00344831AC